MQKAHKRYDAEYGKIVWNSVDRDTPFDWDFRRQTHDAGSNVTDGTPVQGLGEGLAKIATVAVAPEPEPEPEQEPVVQSQHQPEPEPEEEADRKQADEYAESEASNVPKLSAVAGEFKPSQKKAENPRMPVFLNAQYGGTYPQPVMYMSTFPNQEMDYSLQDAGGRVHPYYVYETRPSVRQVPGPPGTNWPQ